MDNSFILQYVHSCPGYHRFFLSWCKFNDPDQCPTEREWEEMLENTPGQDESASHGLTTTQLFEIFPTIEQTAKKKYRELRKKSEEEVNAECEARLKMLLPMEPEQLDLASYIIWMPWQTIEKEKKYWERIIKMFEFKRRPPGDDTITDNDILKAKEFMLTDLVKINRTGFTACPFHNEKTPSCKIYKDNRFHCFGCGEDGDVIDFVMKQEGIDFISAVKRILNK